MLWFYCNAKICTSFVVTKDIKIWCYVPRKTGKHWCSSRTSKN